LLATTIAMSACGGGGTANSSDGGQRGAPITTREMYLSATVEAEDDVTAEISVSLHNGDPLSGTYFLLTGGDALRACAGAQCSPLARDPLGSEYEAELPYLAETTYTLSLARAAGASAPNSVVALPVPFTILAPAPGERVTDGDSVIAQWAPAGADDVVDVWAETRCDHRHKSGLVLLPSIRRGRLAENVDSGTLVADVDTILDAKWMLFPWDEPVVRCKIAIEVLHQRVGTIDAPFGGGSIRGLVSRKVTLDYTPSQP
jgi:hypothetical protein